VELCQSLSRSSCMPSSELGDRHAAASERTERPAGALARLGQAVGTVGDGIAAVFAYPYLQAAPMSTPLKMSCDGTVQPPAQPVRDVVLLPGQVIDRRERDGYARTHACVRAYPSRSRKRRRAAFHLDNSGQPV
jgi:hypothetical protein